MNTRGSTSRRDEPGMTAPADASHRLPPNSAETRSLCICIDDIGLHEGINRAALALVDVHHVHAVSCMVGAPAWAQAADMLRERADQDLDIGLHLDLTEYPLTRPARALPALIGGCSSRLVSTSGIEDELRAQLDAFEQAMGRAPDFVDGHQHVHQLPVVRSALMAQLATRSLPQDFWLRSTRSANGQGAKPWVIAALGQRSLARIAGRRQVPQNTRLLGVYDFKGGEPAYERLLLRWLDLARTGDLLMCHPSAKADLRDPIGLARLAEYAVLRRRCFLDLCRRADVRLTPMSRTIRRMSQETLPSWHQLAP